MIPTPTAGTAELLREAATFNTKVAAAVTKLGKVKDDDVQIAIGAHRTVVPHRSPLLVQVSLVGGDAIALAGPPGGRAPR